jgi:CheY-like chemotaxis protein
MASMLSRKNILLVEDDEVTIALTRRMLIDEGYRVDAATESGNAIKLLTFNNYDLVIMDISMPTLSGFDLLQLMESFHIKSKVVFLSSLDDEITRSKVEKINIDRLISKDKELVKLPMIIKEILD